MLAKHIALYIGAPIEHESERAVLVELLRLLDTSGEHATVLANINLKGRQLDLVVGTDRLTLVLEAKAGMAPLRGSTNGSWAALTRSGRWKVTRNIYVQALDEKNALRDAIREHQGEVTGYPAAYVVFVPGLAAGSNIPSNDHKVSLGGVEGLPDQLAQHSGLRCTAEQWRGFADQHGLERVFDHASAWDQRLLDAQRTLEQYVAAFTATYAPMTTQYKHDTYDADGETLRAPDIERLLLERREDLLLQGPSGCGKSLLSLVLANRLCSKGAIPVVVECKSFEGQFGSALDREATLLDVPSARTLLTAARTLGRPIVVLVDGYNECPSELRVRLTRTLRAASMKFDATVIVSSQIAIDRADLLPLRKVSVASPSQELKVRIAALEAAAVEILSPLLQTIATGMEASLIGQMGHDVTRVSSRSALFDRFVRHRLGEVASQGITLLCCVAELLFERVTFSLSMREVDRILVRERLGAEVLQEVRRAGLLISRGDRLCFVHEMYLNAFAAEAIVRHVGSDVEAMTGALAMPRFNELRAFVVGAIEDEKLLARLLRATTDATLLRACMLGECGAHAGQVVNNAVDAVMDRLRREIEDVRFFISSDHMWQIGVEPNSQVGWTDNERALLSVLSAAVMRGQRCEQLLELVGLLDQRLREEFARLRNEAVQKEMKLLRTSLFAASYVFGQRELGISLVMSALHSGSFASFSDSTERREALKQVWRDVATSGQFYLALALSHVVLRYQQDVLELAIERTLPLLELERWKSLPYHLQLDLMNFVHFLPREDTPAPEKLAQALEALLPELHPLLQGIAIEALSGLGAMDSELQAHEAQVRQEISRLLDNPDIENSAEVAWGIYNGQFDHPFDTAYINAIEDLSDAQHRALMRLACAGANENSFFLGSLIEKLARDPDPLAAPPITRWARLPDPSSSMRQNAIEVFITALTALGHLQTDLPADICPMGIGVREDTMSACGLLYYWMGRHAEATAIAEPMVKVAFDTLAANPSLAVGVLSDISRSMMNTNRRGVLIVNTFPERSVLLARAALQSGSSMQGYFPGPAFFGEDDAERFAISIIEAHGTADDLELLRTFADHAGLSGVARKALAAIESRATSDAGGQRRTSASGRLH
ncbi:hypothetical protein J2X20_002760 [Pelomonas saccharophila]|uniref:NERD domain-containing protein n=1 Tax=Roseateles saccharophilus TaxID=304 RepID=A0ABU1YMM8_ROSSA|nr:nuclease-related domain-containing protein [Roseateles saccharophilus]MDR7270102.1 hypothetical protein [Roseateles saccharophilus]